LAKTELGNQTELELIEYSPEERFDYAILRTAIDLEEERVTLEPRDIAPHIEQ